MIDSDALHAFAVFAERLNFTHAAELLAISQPALHVKIGKLARTLNVPLYLRVGRRLELTEDGKRLQAFAREMLERHQEFLGDLKREDRLQPVVLAAGEGVYLYLLGDAIQAFTTNNEAPLRLLTRKREAAIESVRTGEAHLAVTALEDTPDDVATELLARVDMVLAMPEDHPLSQHRSIRLRHLSKQRLIIPPPGLPHRTTLQRALFDAGINWHPALEASGWPLMLHFCRLGLGLAIVNGCCHLPPGVVGRPMPQLPGIPYFLIRRQGAPLTASTQKLAGVIRNTIHSL